jgi:uncharacterized protein YbbC (DUF1343 family)
LCHNGLMGRRQGVLTGIDVLARDGFARLHGRRAGLVTNHTGLLRDGRTTIDALHEAPGVTLTALFGPEHGIRGEFDVPQIADSVDYATGLHVFSLYGERHAPTAAQLEGIDTLVFDIQDIGCRFYTYISTLGHLLEAASEHDVGVMVLDRPNPITGVFIEGPLADADKLSFTAFHTLPVRHGMTAGEIALMLAGERGLTCELEIMQCEGWRRADWFDATGLLWTNPSPNMRSVTQAMLYPGVGLLEMTNVSVGRGTDTPFELVGAPYIQPCEFAGALNDQKLPGVRFVPVQFTPRASVHAGVVCGGVNILVTDRQALDAVHVGLTMALTLRRDYLEAWETEKFLTLLANEKCYTGVMAGRSVGELTTGWIAELARFKAIRARYLLSP